MRKVKIIKFIPLSVYKTIIFASVIPWIIGFAIVFVTTVIKAMSSQNGESAANLIGKALPMFLSPILYGLIFLIFIASYNWLAPRFGGLEIEIDDNKEDPENVEQ